MNLPLYPMIQKLFTDLKINQKIKDALHAMSVSEMTPVQEHTIPELLNRDVIVQSQTGSGKTLAYLVPVVDAILSPKQPEIPYIKALVIVPTRELCAQVATVAANFGVSTTVFIGGIPIEEDLKKQDTELVVGTPGRLLEIISVNSKRFSKVKYLILDESDKLVSQGFEEKLQKLIEFLPRGRRTGLFSATVSDEVARFCQRWLKNPASIKITDALPENLQLRYLFVDPARKLDALREIVRGRRAIVFFSTCNCVDFYYEMLTEVIEGRLYKIHGKMNQKDRNEVYKSFESDGKILLCTDVAARGIDFKNIELVVHFDVPKDYTNIVHRSGRTARMGMSGEAVLFLMPNEKTFVNFLKLKGIEAEEFDGWECGDKQVRDKPFEGKLLKLAVQGFVSYIRAYKEHILNYILSYKELDFDGLAELFRLERIPSMTELRNVKFKHFRRDEKGVEQKK